MGSLVGLKLALEYPDLVSKLILMGPPPSPLPETGSQDSYARVTLVRRQGMLGFVDAIIQAGLSTYVQQTNPLAVAAVCIFI
jgi:pimeloyl-ACP methyl ester carboxylesterase